MQLKEVRVNLKEDKLIMFLEKKNYLFAVEFPSIQFQPVLDDLKILKKNLIKLKIILIMLLLNCTKIFLRNYLRMVLTSGM